MRKLPLVERHGVSRARVVTVVVLLLFTVVVGRWMVTPFDDWVPLVMPKQLPAGVDPNGIPTAAHYRCSAPFAGQDKASITNQASRALELQTLSREPCNDIWPQRRILAIADLILSLGLFVSLGIWWLRPKTTKAQGPAISGVGELAS